MAPKKPVGVIADILADLNKDAKPGNVIYLKPGDTTIKLVMPAGRTDLRQFYERYMATFKGEQFPYFLVAGVITQADEDGVEDETRVKYIKVTRTILTDIANLLAKKWDLFGNPSPLIVITSGKGKNKKVEYKTTAIPDTFAVSDEVQWPTQTITEAALDQQERSAEMDESGGKTAAASPVAEALS